MADAKKILLIDDDSFFVSIISNAFVKNGFAVQSASTGKMGVELARTEKPDVILLDLTMSGMDGHATLEALKADAATKKIPTIVLSSLSGEADIAKAKNAGAADYLVKMQHTPEELVARVKKFLAA